MSFLITASQQYATGSDIDLVRLLSSFQPLSMYAHQAGASQFNPTCDLRSGFTSLCSSIQLDPHSTTLGFRHTRIHASSSYMSICLLDGYSPPISARSRRFVGIATGLRVVDVLFPIAQGQRELVIGDRQTGKTQIIISSSFSQLFRNGQVGARKVIVSYLSNLGQRTSSSVRAYNALRYNSAANYSVSLLASVTSTMSAQFIGPLSITALAELSRNTGNHAHVSYDDFSKHAVAYRQLCLYLRKPAGREAFPSDVFYLHARILERACCLSHNFSLGTLLSLPVIETLSNDLSAYIATNVISITDGQLYLDVTLFGMGSCPAVNIDKSVSRVGAKSQDAVFRAISFRILSLINNYKQESDVAVKSEGFKQRAHRYSHLMAIFVQRSCSDRWSNLLYLWMLVSGLLDSIPSNMLHLTI
jgi:proton translocating ATP synthase F1 alpha subunit